MTENPQRTVLVTGATGGQGGAVSQSLIERGFQVRVLTRDSSRPAAQELANQGAEVVEGDMSDRSAADLAVEGVHGVFSVQTPFEGGPEAEVVQGTTLADAAREAGVEHFVYSSVGSAYRNTGIPHFDSKQRIEEHVRYLGLPYTILRPVFFVQNWEGMRAQILDGVLAQPLDPDKPLQQVAVEDIAVFARMAFENPETWIGRELDLAGDELTMPQVADIMTRVTGGRVTHRPLSFEEFREVAGEEMTVMYEWFNEYGYEADIEALRKEHPGLTGLEQYLNDHGWAAEQ